MCALLQPKGSDSEDVPEKPIPSEHKKLGMIHRDPTQDAIVGEFAQRLAMGRMPSSVSPACLGVCNRLK